MKYRFVLGVGRSGTTLLGRLMALSTSPMKFISEPFPGIERRGNPKCVDPSFIMPIPNSEEVKSARNNIVALSKNEDVLKKELSGKRVERSDNNPDFLLIKEVHTLLAFPMILSGLDYKAVVVTRDTTRVIDSYFHGHTKKQRIYLIEEFQYIKDYVRGRTRNFSCDILNDALQSISLKLIKHIKRPSWMTSELSRQVLVTEIINHFLTAWARTDERVMYVAFEDLCSTPLEVCKKLYDFLDLGYDETTISDIEKITKGKSTAYYDTDKDSGKILKQEYKYLSEKDLTGIKKLIRR